MPNRYEIRAKDAPPDTEWWVYHERVYGYSVSANEFYAITDWRVKGSLLDLDRVFGVQDLAHTTPASFRTWEQIGEATRLNAPGGCWVEFGELTE